MHGGPGRLSPYGLQSVLFFIFFVHVAFSYCIFMFHVPCSMFHVPFFMFYFFMFHINISFFMFHVPISHILFHVLFCMFHFTSSISMSSFYFLCFYVLFHDPLYVPFSYFMFHVSISCSISCSILHVPFSCSVFNVPYIFQIYNTFCSEMTQFATVSISTIKFVYILGILMKKPNWQWPCQHRWLLPLMLLSRERGMTEGRKTRGTYSIIILINY